MFPLGVLRKKPASVLLNLKFEEANNSTVFIDSSLYNRVITSSGTAVISTNNPLSGSSSLLLGTNGSISIPNFTTPANFIHNTIEFRIRADLATLANNESQGVFIKGYSYNFALDYSYYCVISRNASGNGGTLLMGYVPNQGSRTELAIAVPDLSQNNHVAFDRRTNGTIAGFLNGVLQSTIFSPFLVVENNLALELGASVYYNLVQIPKFKGYLDNFEINNAMKYGFISNFTPPT